MEFKKSILKFLPSESEIKILKSEVDKFKLILEEAIKNEKINADVFIGGSFAKGTIAKSENYDVDFFIRFDWKYEDLSPYVEKALKRIKNLNYEKIHGSRDYFRVSKGKFTFEIVPVLKIKKPIEARNVTDLSYFHVNYTRKKINKNMRNEVILLKKFCKAQKVYGAESYINGFSGYGLECLIIYYKSFEKTLKALVSIKEGKRLVIDPAKHYKKKEDIFFQMNESKSKGPVILVDPTFKERNVLSALNWNSLKIFQDASLRFLKKPSEKFFILEDFNEESFKSENKKAEFVKVILESNKQEGDIAGTKMKKFSKLLMEEIGKYFEIKKQEFNYGGEKEAEWCLLLKKKEEGVRIGPPLDRVKDVAAFKKKNKETYEKNGFIHAKIKMALNAKKFLKNFAKKEKNRKMKEMSIIGMKVED